MQRIHPKPLKKPTHKVHDLMAIIDAEMNSISEAVPQGSGIKADVDKAKSGIIIYSADLHLGWALDEEFKKQWFVERKVVDLKEQGTGKRLFKNPKADELVPYHGYLTRSFFCPKGHTELGKFTSKEVALHKAASALYELYYHNVLLLLAIKELQLKQIFSTQIGDHLSLEIETQKDAVVKTVEVVNGVYEDRFSVVDKVTRYYDLAAEKIDLHEHTIDCDAVPKKNMKDDDSIVASYGRLTEWAEAMLEAVNARMEKVNKKLQPDPLDLDVPETKAANISSKISKPKEKPSMFAALFSIRKKPSVTKKVRFELPATRDASESKDEPVKKVQLFEPSHFQSPDLNPLHIEAAKNVEDPNENEARRILINYRKEIYKKEWQLGHFGGEEIKNLYTGKIMKIPLWASAMLRMIENPDMKSCSKTLKQLQQLGKQALENQPHTFFNRRSLTTTEFYSRVARGVVPKRPNTVDPKQASIRL